MPALFDSLSILIERGGIIMVPLLALSIAALAMIVERSLFWWIAHRATAVRRAEHLLEALRVRNRTRALALTEGDEGPYAVVARRLAERGAGDAVALAAVDAVRPRIERFMTALSTTITAAPLLGILGTVIGIIRSFELLGGHTSLTDPRAVAAGIAEALLTTAFGLIIALLTLFPYMLFRGHVQRAFLRLESLIAAAREASTSPGEPPAVAERGPAERTSGALTPPGAHAGRVPVAVLAIIAGAVAASTALPEAQASERSIRRQRTADGLVLETAVRRFVDPVRGTEVLLAGVTHIGDAAYYAALGDLLGTCDVVLFELVRPAGAGAVAGATPQARRDATRAAAMFLADAMAVLPAAVADGEAQVAPPTSVAGLAERLRATDTILANLVAATAMDAWGHPFTVSADAVRSLGADGAEGGEGEAADIIVDVPPATGMAGRAGGLQASLAQALGLAFQLHEIDYASPSWRASDLTIDDLDARLRARGVPISLGGGGADGGGGPALFGGVTDTVARLMLTMIERGDRMSGGTLRRSLRLLLVELLGDPATLEGGLAQLGEDFHAIIIEERNEVPVRDLQALLAVDPVPGRIALVYGAGHLPDLAARLAALGLEEGESTWLSAITVDLAAEGVPAAERLRLLQAVRRMHMMMRSQMQMPAPAPGRPASPRE